MAQGEPERETIQQAIAAWPIEDQIALARSILARTGTAAAAQPAGQGSAWGALYGTAANSQDAPGDEQVARWMDDSQAAKYGG